MRLLQSSMLVAGLVLVLGTPQWVLADHHGEGRDHGRSLAPQGGQAVWLGGLRVERSSWVMVFGLDLEGRLVLQTQGRNGVFISPELPASIVDDRVGWNHESPECAWQLVVISDVPFAAPRQFSRHDGFRVDRSGQWSADNSRKLCRLLGLRPEAVRVWLCPVAHRDAQVYLHTGGVFSAQIEAGLLCGGQVYIDGRFIGRGAGVLVGVAPGRRRVTVVTEDGRKCSQWVSFPCPPSDQNCSVRSWVHP